MAALHPILGRDCRIHARQRLFDLLSAYPVFRRFLRIRIPRFLAHGAYGASGSLPVVDNLANR